MKTLVAYFSCSGQTKQVANVIAQTIEAKIHEIQPAIPYSSADLNWQDKNSRSSIEMNDKTSRPAIKNRVADMEEYEVVFLGFPIWWYVAPTIINTFLESYHLQGKTIVPFATSGGSGAGKTNAHLQVSCPNQTKLCPTKVFYKQPTTRQIKEWITHLHML